MKTKILLFFLLLFSLGLKAQIRYTSKLPYVLNNAHDLEIRGDSINGNTQVCVTLNNCTNIRFVHCKFKNSIDRAMRINGGSHITVDSCFFKGVGDGIYVFNATIGYYVFRDNQFVEMSDPGGIPTPRGRGHAIGFNIVSGPGIKILRNRIYNPKGLLTGVNPNPGGGDQISLYKTDGTPSDWVDVGYNKLVGGGTPTGAQGFAFIVAGDQGGSYQRIHNNDGVVTGYVGIQIQGGHHIKLDSNRIYSNQRLWSGTGLASGNFDNSHTPTHDDTVIRNQVNWIAGWAPGGLGRRDTTYKPNLNPLPYGFRTLNTYNASINESIIDMAHFIDSFYVAPIPHTVINWRNKHDLTISLDTIMGGTLPCITLINCQRIRITKCRLINSTEVAIFIDSCDNIKIDSNFWARVKGGVAAKNTTKVQVMNNEGLNMLGPPEQGTFVELQFCNGPAIRVNGNKFQSDFGYNISYLQSGVNLFQCYGTPTDPIQVIGNTIRGGGPNPNSSGLLVGNHGGAYQTINNNICINTGAYGLLLLGGSHISIINNVFYNTLFTNTYNGSPVAYTTTGISISNYSSSPMVSNTISNNRIYWRSGKFGNIIFNQAIAPGIPIPKGWATNTFTSPLSEKFLPITLLRAGNN